jgi:hypothetical protein
MGAAAGLEPTALAPTISLLIEPIAKRDFGRKRALHPLSYAANTERRSVCGGRLQFLSSQAFLFGFFREFRLKRLQFLNQAIKRIGVIDLRLLSRIAGDPLFHPGLFELH